MSECRTSLNDKFAEHWRQTYATYMNDPHAKASWRLRAICYSVWPLLFNRVMIFFERYRARKLIKQAKWQLRDQKVLDIGCGTGRWSQFFEGYGARVLGTDLFPELLVDNRTRIPTLSFAAMSATDLALKDGTMDLVSVGIVLQHIPRPRKGQALSEIFRVLKIGGKAFILEAMAPDGYEEKEGDVGSKLRVDEWTDLLSENGFEIMGQASLHAYPLASLHGMLKEKIGVTIKWVKQRIAKKNPPSAQGAWQPTQGVQGDFLGAVLGKRHRFYQMLDQNLLRVIACFSFPLEFLWEAFNLPASHRIFLVQKKISQERTEKSISHKPMKTDSGSGRLTFRLINNTAAQIIGEVFYRGIKFLTAIWIIRSLSGEQYGQYSFIYTYLSFFEMFVSFGLNAILTREVAQNKDKAPQILGNAVVIQLSLSFLVIPLALYLIKVLNYPLSIQQGVSLASLQFFFTVRTVFDVIYRVQLKMIYAVFWDVIRAVLNLFFVALAVCYRPSIEFFIVAYLASSFIGLIGFALFTRRFIIMDFRPDFNLMRRLVKESIPLLFSGYLTLLYYRIDVFMLSKMKGFLDVGYYSVATRLTETLGVIATALMVSLFPILSRTFRDDRQHFEEMILKAFKSLLLTGLPIAIGGNLAAHDLIGLLFGAEYFASTLTLQILLWCTFFYFFGSLLANILTACGKQIVDAWISFSQVFVNIGLNLILIPVYSYNGAAVATVLCSIFGVGLTFFYAARSKDIKMPVPWKEFRDSVAINACFLIFLLFFKYVFPLPVLIYIFSGIVSYGMLLALFRVITWRQVQMYLSHWKKVKLPVA